MGSRLCKRLRFGMYATLKPRNGTRASNRIFFHFPVSEGYNRVDNRIANIVKIIG